MQYRIEKALKCQQTGTAKKTQKFGFACFS